ncbi:MAG: tRNA (5-methylaminomethyl-2-thiouridine)(34)-methyltransferase MnmD [Bacteroidota bacterium]
MAKVAILNSPDKCITYLCIVMELNKSESISLFSTADGSHSVHSGQFGVTYHSAHGAVTESAHVFIDHGLGFVKSENKPVAVLETGFGTGLNAFMTLLEAEKPGLSVYYCTLEIYPLDPVTATALNYPDVLGVPAYNEVFCQLHTCEWNRALSVTPTFLFEKREESITSFVREGTFDVIYFDAFDPQAQPELWTEEVMNRMYRSLRTGGVLVTYCAQGQFRRNLRSAGFSTERLPGPPGKREMTRAIKI